MIAPPSFNATDWGRITRGTPPRMNVGAVIEMTVHYTGTKSVDRSRQQIPTYLKATERYQMARQSNLSAISYNFAVDKWGRIWTLRGWEFRNAANGTASNTTSFSVLLLNGLEDNETTIPQTHSLRWLYEDGCRRTGRRLVIRGHQEHKATACPGPAVMRLIRSNVIQNPRPVTTSPPTSQTPSVPQVTAAYVVASGDSYWGIAARRLGAGARWPEIAKLNNHKTLRPGMTIQIPRAAVPTAPTPPQPQPVSLPPRIVTVEKGDSYWALAARHLGSGRRWREIADLNNNEALRPGVAVKVPRVAQ